MEALIGIRGSNFVLLATDTRYIRSIVVMKAGEEKLRSLHPRALLAYSGEPGDTVNFAEFVQRNVQLYGVKNEKELGIEAAANWTRKCLADALRSRSPYQVNVLLGGFEDDTPKLFWIDYLAAMVEVPFAFHGYAAFFCSSILDRHWRPNLTEAEAIELLKLCLNELKIRFIVNFPEFAVSIVDANGTRQIQL